MKIELWIQVGTCKVEEIIDVEKDWNIPEKEWVKMDRREKNIYVDDWMMNHLDAGFQELKN